MMQIISRQGSSYIVQDTRTRAQFLIVILTGGKSGPVLLKQKTTQKQTLKEKELKDRQERNRRILQNMKNNPDGNK